jgi:hypothetical protein
MRGLAVAFLVKGDLGDVATDVWDAHNCFEGMFSMPGTDKGIAWTIRHALWRPATLGTASIVMSSVCLLSISFPYKTFSFVPPFLFPWGYSPGSFLLWIAVCVALSIIAGVRGARLWFLGAAWAVFTLLFAMSAAT